MEIALPDDDVVTYGRDVERVLFPARFQYSRRRLQPGVGDICSDAPPTPYTADDMDIVLQAHLRRTPLEFPDTYWRAAWTSARTLTALHSLEDQPMPRSARDSLRHALEAEALGFLPVARAAYRHAIALLETEKDTMFERKQIDPLVQTLQSLTKITLAIEGAAAAEPYAIQWLVFLHLGFQLSKPLAELTAEQRHTNYQYMANMFEVFGDLLVDLGDLTKARNYYEHAFELYHRITPKQDMREVTLQCGNETAKLEFKLPAELAMLDISEASTPSIARVTQKLQHMTRSGVHQAAIHPDASQTLRQ